MSSTLMWRPVVPIEGYDLPFQLKVVISRRLWDTDGSCGDGEAVMDRGSIEYLKGLCDAGIKGADQLIAAIEKYDAVLLWHEH